jgi:16S rRNA G1207 methylase RsmC
VAARFRQSRGLLVDRDLLAVEFARRNAAAAGLPVAVEGSLGYRDVPAAAGPFDWILCNFPARAGERVVEGFVAGGRARLRPGGEMRIVVISPLAPAVREAALRRGFECRTIVERKGHAVLSFPPGATSVPGDTDTLAGAGEAMYERDRIELRLPERLCLTRPTDLADEPHRLPLAIPLLAENLPRSAPGRILAFRAGYGLVPALALARYPAATVVAADRDLLAAAFTRRNSAAQGERLRVLECLGLAAASSIGPFDLILGELLPALGPAATFLELREAHELLAPGGRALVLGLVKQWKEFLRFSPKELGLTLRRRKGAVALYQMGRR